MGALMDSTVHPLRYRTPAEAEAARRAAELSGARYRAAHGAATDEDAALLADSGDPDDRQCGRVLLRQIEDEADLDRRVMLARGPSDVDEFRAQQADLPDPFPARVMALITAFFADPCPTRTMWIITGFFVAISLASIGWQVWHP